MTRMQVSKIVRCRKCIMPVNYPGISLDNDGICNFCRNPKQMIYQGPEAMKNKILSYGNMAGKAKYDCALGFSGGRDSSYLLYFLCKVLKLRVLAFTIDNGYIPAETHQNIKNIKEILGVDVVTTGHPYLEKCFKHHLKTWMHKPSPPMIAALCVGCRLGLARGKYEILRKYQIPVYVTGGSPFEGNSYKTNLLRFPTQSQSKFALILGYISEVIKNAGWVSNIGAFNTQIQEFRAFYGYRYNKKLRRQGFLTISPYYKYIRWEEQKIITTIEHELGWRQNSQTGSTWRGDCEIALLKMYLYKKLLGFNDKDDSLSDLIRDGQITRAEALQRLEHEQHISDDALKEIVEKNGLNYDYFKEL